MKKYDAAIILGGGRYSENELTPLSIQRLNRGYELYRRKVVSKLITLGGQYSTYSQKAIKFQKPTAQLRKEYLLHLGVKAEDIIKIEKGGDTICEAFATREEIQKEGFKNLILITSDKHLPRALWIFQRVFGSSYSIVGEEVPCGDILIPKEENEYFKATKEFFQRFPPDIPSPNLSTWFKDHAELYTAFQNIHNKYHPLGKESQAYAGVKR